MSVAPVHVGKCQTCGKLCFRSRKAAKKFMVMKFPKDRMAVYRCGSYYHFGHAPPKVLRGTQQRRSN